MCSFHPSGPQVGHRIALNNLGTRSVTQSQRRVNAQPVEIHGTGLRWPNVVRLKPRLVPRSDSKGAFGKDRRCSLTTAASPARSAHQPRLLRGVS